MALNVSEELGINKKILKSNPIPINKSNNNLNVLVVILKHICTVIKTIMMDFLDV